MPVTYLPKPILPDRENFNTVSPMTDLTAAIRKQSRTILIALLFPTLAIILNDSMFGVGLPTIRNEFAMAADVAAWLTIAFSLPFMMFMPVYGRLGDELGKSRLLLAGTLLFGLGSILALVANSLPLIFIGRIIQGAGSAGITPLSLAIIMERFATEERGRALGTWNSIAPGTSIFAPTLGGFLVDSLGWRTIFIPVIAAAILAFIIVRWQIPPLRDKPNWSVLRSFDWGGAILLNGTIILLVLYLSSRPVTGIEPLQDWRLLLGFLLSGAGFILWERRHAIPLVDFHILRHSNFSLASISSGLRMALMIGITFLLPLYLADIYDLPASQIGLLATIHAVALFLSIRWGGTLADRWSNRWLITISLILQLTMMIYFALLPGDLSLFWIGLGSIIHGLGSGLSLAPLHRTALGGIAPEQTGVAAGIYSMTRFAGSMLAVALAGVILQTGLDRGLPLLDAYQAVFIFLAATGIAGVLITSRLRD
jgi:EmrB/QacA subfamily drug resistance transporter